MSTRKPAPASQPNGCASCLLVLVALWLFSWIIQALTWVFTALAWTASALWSLTVGLFPTLLGAFLAFGIGHAADVPPDKKQLAATGAFLLGLLLNALMLFWQPQLQPWLFTSLATPPPTGPASTRSAPDVNNIGGNAVLPVPQNPPASSATPKLQLTNAQWEIAPLVKTSELTARLTIRGREADVPRARRFDFDVVRWTLVVRNNSARPSLQVEYSPAYFKTSGAALKPENGFRDSTSRQLRDFGALRSPRRFLLKARPGTTQTVMLNELMPRSSARQIRRASISLRALAPAATP